MFNSFVQVLPRPQFLTVTQLITSSNFDGQITFQPKVIKIVTDKDGKEIERVELKP